MNTASAIPAWLQEILPRFFVARPAFTEALYAAIVAFSKSILTVLYSLWVGYSVLVPQSHQSLLGYLLVIKAGWFSVAAPVLWSAYNGRVAHEKAAAAQPSSPTKGP